MKLFPCFPGRFQAGDKYRGQLVGLAGERIELPGGKVAAVDGESEPEMAFIGFFKGDLQFREKFRFRATSPGSPIVCGNTGCATGQLSRNDARASLGGHGIGDLQATKGGGTSARQKFAHECLLAPNRPGLQFYVRSSNL